MIDKRGLLSSEAVEDGNGYASFPPSGGAAPLPSAHATGEKRGCRDPLFLAAFILNLGTFTFVCWWMGGLGNLCFGSSTLSLSALHPPSLPSSHVGVIVWLAADYGAAALKEAPKPDAENPAVKTHDGETGGEKEGGREVGRKDGSND